MINLLNLYLLSLLITGIFIIPYIEQNMHSSIAECTLDHADHDQLTFMGGHHDSGTGVP